MHVKEFGWECLERGNWTRKGGLFSNMTVEEGKAGQAEGHAFYLPKSEMVSVHTLLSKLPAGLRSQSSWSLGTRSGLHAPWGVSVSMQRADVIVRCWLNYVLLYNMKPGLCVNLRLTWLTRLADWQAPVMPLIWPHQGWNCRLVPLRQAFHVDAGEPSSSLHGHVRQTSPTELLLHPSTNS